MSVPEALARRSRLVRGSAVNIGYHSRRHRNLKDPASRKHLHLVVP